jgi:hypothetical protein
MMPQRTSHAAGRREVTVAIVQLVAAPISRRSGTGLHANRGSHARPTFTIDSSLARLWAGVARHGRAAIVNGVEGPELTYFVEKLDENSGIFGAMLTVGMVRAERFRL